MSQPATKFEHLDLKKHRVFEHVKLELEAPPVDAGAVERLNTVIRKHNQACDDFENRAEEARNRVAADMIAAELEEFARRRDAEDRARADVQTKGNYKVYLAFHLP